MIQSVAQYKRLEFLNDDSWSKLRFYSDFFFCVYASFLSVLDYVM